MKQLGNLIEYKRNGNVVDFKFENGHAKVEVITSEIVRVIYDPLGQASKSKAARYTINKPVEFITKQQGRSVAIRTDKLIVIINDDFYIDIYDSKGNMIVRDYRDNITNKEELDKEHAELMESEGHSNANNGQQSLYVAKEMKPDDCFYGLGDKTGFMNKRHYDYKMWNTDNPAPHVDSFQSLYKSIPFFITLNEKSVYGIFFDNTFETYFDMGKTSNDYYMFGASNGAIDYYFIYGEKMPEVVEGYTYLTGTTPLPQMWTLGYQQSRWSYIDEEEVAELAQNMRKYKIPCDVIHLDIDYMDEYRVFTWDDKRHKDFENELRTLKQDGFKVVTIIDPGVKVDENYSVYKEGIEKDYFVKDEKDEVYVNAVWPGDSVFPSFGEKKVRKWWGRNHKVLMDAGVSGIWNDMNEPASFNGPLPNDLPMMDEGRKTTHAEMHNVYGHNMAKATYEFMKSYTGKRPFVITRACYAGTQKYSTGWTGDNHSIWAHLQMAIPQLCNLGLSGMTFVGTDIGGFGSDTTPELLSRWIQVGCFSPLFRNHASIGTKHQEPWSFGKETLEIYRKFVNLRYELLPYIYDLMWESEQTGAPVMRPLVYEYQDDMNARNCNDQFMVGSSILVSPVVTQGSEYKVVYLPEGRWVDYNTHEVFEGNQHITYYAPIDVCPIFVKENSIIPKYLPMQYVGEHNMDSLILEVYGDNATYTHYQDNKTDFEYKNGTFNKYKFVFKDKLMNVVIEHQGYDVKYKNIDVRVLNNK